MTPRHFAWQAWHNLTSTFVSRGRRVTNSHPPSFCVAGVALMVLGGALGPGFGAWGAAPLCVAGVAQPHIHLRFTWQAWHNLTSTVVLRGRRGTDHLSHTVTDHLSHTISHTPTLSHAIFHTQLCHTPSFTHQLCHTPSFTHLFVTPHLSYTIFHTSHCHTPSFTHHLSHTTLSHTIFHHTIFNATLSHTPSFAKPSFTHHFVPHHLSHTTLSHALFHTQLSHTPSCTHHFVTHTIFLSHTPAFTYNFVTHNFVLLLGPPPPPLSFLPSPSPLQHLGAFYSKKLSCGVIRSFNCLPRIYPLVN